jgi:hypothetical protein
MHTSGLLNWPAPIGPPDASFALAERRDGRPGSRHSAGPPAAGLDARRQPSQTRLQRPGGAGTAATGRRTVEGDGGDHVARGR